MLNELEIKALALNALCERRSIAPNALIASEFRLGRSSLRADLAILDRSQFVGIEVKSARDGLRRLTSQIDGYVSYFDRIIIVLASKHLLRLEDAALPANVEVCEVDLSGEFRPFRPPSKLLPPRKSLLDLLTQEERRKFQLGLPPYVRADADALREAERNFFYAAFSRRFGRTSNKFWQSVGGRKVQASDLQTLSRFLARRQKFKDLAKHNQKKWDAWTQMVEVHLSNKLLD